MKKTERTIKDWVIYLICSYCKSSYAVNYSNSSYRQQRCCKETRLEGVKEKRQLWILKNDFYSFYFFAWNFTEGKQVSGPIPQGLTEVTPANVFEIRLDYARVW